ncbi:MAG: chemotaxis protein CheW [Chitinispirillaceae bacterium]
MEEKKEVTMEMAALEGKYLTFRLAEEGYGLEILKVQEIIGMMSITRIPRTPDFIRGVINLRGKVIPVIDLRLKFSLEKKEDTEKTCIIVVQVKKNADDTVTMGIIVDEVSEVLDIKAEQIEPPPSFGAAMDTDFILGMGKASQKVVMLLDVDKVLSRSEIEDLSKV